MFVSDEIFKVIVRMSVKKIEYSHGCIVKLRVENFMHYSDQKIEPLPGFNVIIGHNGSGKSALINAICIGLGKICFVYNEGSIILVLQVETLTLFKDATTSILLSREEPRRPKLLLSFIIMMEITGLWEVASMTRGR